MDARHLSLSLSLSLSALIVAFNELLNNAQVAATETDRQTGGREGDARARPSALPSGENILHSFLPGQQ